MKPESKRPLKATAMRRKQRPVFRLRTVANILSRSIWSKGRKAASVSSIRTNRRCSALNTRRGILVFPHPQQVMISLQVCYEGHVQGVGFRFTVRHIAKGFDVTGWVRNLPDGRVELQVSGDHEEIRAFLDQVAQSELHSLIRKQTENKLNEPVAARSFEIRYD